MPFSRSNLSPRSRPSVASAQLFRACSLILMGCALSASADDLSSDSVNLSPTPAAKVIIIDTVIIAPGDVFSDSMAETFWGYRLANRLHFKTRAQVIAREVLFKAGDPFDTALVSETERNIRALRFIYDAQATLDTLSDGAIALVVQTVDKWSLSGGIEWGIRAGRGETELGVKETNIAGYGQEVGVTFVGREIDPDFAVIHYNAPRLATSQLALSSSFQTDVFARRYQLRLTAPFRRLEQREAFGLSFTDERVRRIHASQGDTLLITYSDGFEVAEFYARRWGPRAISWFAVIEHSYQNLHVDFPLSNSSSPLYPTLLADTAGHDFSFTFGRERREFRRLMHINHFQRVEDISLNSKAEVIAGQLRHEGLGWPFVWRWGAHGRVALAMSSTLVAIDVSQTEWRDNGARVRLFRQAQVSAFGPWISWLTAAGRVSYQTDRRNGAFDGLSLDELRGMRGYPVNYRTGSHLLVANFETRIVPGLRLLSAELGAIAHLDWGVIGVNGLPLGEGIWSAGAGLRADLGQAGNGRMVRLDFSYARARRAWEISAGVGQFFEW